jgi:predicted RNase H-like HicB family nuclease
MFMPTKKEHDSGHYTAIDYPVELSRWCEEEESYWVAEIPDLPGCVSDGESPDEAVESLGEAKRLWIEARLENGHHIPEPTDTRGYSGRLLLRMPKSLHRKLAAQSRREGTSLNMYVVSLLSERSAGIAADHLAVAERSSDYQG